MASALANRSRHTTVPLGPPPPPPPKAEKEDHFAGFTRFELELEFVQALANPNYLMHLASQKLLADPRFVAYLDYLRYWSRPPYVKYLDYPGPTLKHLQLLQLERFRQEIISPERAYWLGEGAVRATIEWKRKGITKDK